MERPTSKLEALGLTATFDNSRGVEERRKYAEEYFGTASDPDQIPINQESLTKLNTLTPYALNCAYEGEKPVSWTVSIPTSTELMNAFLNGDITEKEMFDRTNPGDNSALYICAAFTLPEYRGKGIAKALLTEQTQAFMNENPDLQPFAWIWSDEGDKLIKSLPDEVAAKIKVRK